MTKKLPDWAIRRAVFADREKIAKPKYRDFVRIIWPEKRDMRDWSKTHGWKKLWFGFKRTFIEKMIEDS
ncbi:MAG: hypothetical protein KDB79_08580 [Acidobacteria bacterium]|nr:hypothetical protein [Acidobacteriota bacterium]